MDLGTPNLVTEDIDGIPRCDDTFDYLEGGSLYELSGSLHATEPTEPGSFNSTPAAVREWAQAAQPLVTFLWAAGSTTPKEIVPEIYVNCVIPHNTTEASVDNATQTENSAGSTAADADGTGESVQASTASSTSVVDFLLFGTFLVLGAMFAVLS
jgi:hypothetical protein